MMNVNRYLPLWNRWTQLVPLSVNPRTIVYEARDDDGECAIITHLVFSKNITVDTVKKSMKSYRDAGNKLPVPGMDKCVVMEDGDGLRHAFVLSADLKRLPLEDLRLEEQERGALCRELLTAVGRLHDSGFVHGHIALENLLWSKDAGLQLGGLSVTNHCMIMGEFVPKITVDGIPGDIIAVKKLLFAIYNGGSLPQDEESVPRDAGRYVAAILNQSYDNAADLLSAFRKAYAADKEAAMNAPRGEAEETKTDDVAEAEIAVEAPELAAATKKIPDMTTVTPPVGFSVSAEFQLAADVDATGAEAIPVMAEATDVSDKAALPDAADAADAATESVDISDEINAKQEMEDVPPNAQTPQRGQDTAPEFIKNAQSVQEMQEIQGRYPHLAVYFHVFDSEYSVIRPPMTPEEKTEAQPQNTQRTWSLAGVLAVLAVAALVVILFFIIGINRIPGLESMAVESVEGLLGLWLRE